MLIFMYGIFQFTAKKGLTTSLVVSKIKYKVVHWLEELSRTATSFKLSGNTKLPLERTDANVEKYLFARESHFKILVQQYSFMIVFNVFLAAGLLVIGGILVMNQQMNIGQFIAAEIMILVVTASVEKMILSIESIYDILTSLEKIGQVTDLELEGQSGIDLEMNPQDNGMEIEIDNLSFTYPDASTKTLKNISLTINKGELLVITGGMGSGKNTLLHVIAGLYNIQEGSMSYNKLPVGNISLNSIREQIGDHMTMERLFEGTVLENISLGRDLATFENVKWAIENLGLNDFIKKLPEGYNTMIQTQGKGLPESTVTKLLLARSVATKPKLLFLENTFEQLDEKDCKQIIDFITAKQHGWTMVTVSSNKYLAKLSDKIIVLKAGEIAEIGTYDELKDSGSFKTDSNA